MSPRGDGNDDPYRKQNRRDRYANVFKRPEFLDRHSKRRDRESRFKRPAFMDRYSRRRDMPGRLKPPSIIHRLNRPIDRPSRLKRPNWLDKPSDRRDREGSLKRPEFLDNRPDWLIRPRSLLQRPKFVDDSRFKTRRFRLTALAVLVVALVATVLIVRNPGGDDGKLSKEVSFGDSKLTRTGIGYLNSRRITTLEAPVSALATLPGTSRFFAAERQGRVFAIDDPTQPVGAKPLPAALKPIVLDVRDEVSVSTVGDGGILGLAVDPQAAHLFMTEVAKADGAIKLVRYDITDRAPVPQSRTELLSVPHAGTDHYGGSLTVGPDNMLYVGIGVGGTYLESAGIAQDPTDLQGSIIRIDPSVPGPTGYGIPPDNPATKVPGARPELFAKGLLSPGGLSWDTAKKALWLTDEGAGRINEVDRIPASDAVDTLPNLGWDLAEGDLRLRGVPPEDAIRPTAVLAGDVGLSCHPTGGVFAGPLAPSTVRNHYIVSDSCGGILGLGSPGKKEPEASTVAYLGGEPPTALAQGPDGQLLAGGLTGGLYALEESASDLPPTAYPLPYQPPNPASVVTDACGLLPAFASISPQATQGKSPDQVKQLVTDFETVIDAFQKGTTGEQKADFDQIRMLVQPIIDEFEANGYRYTPSIGTAITDLFNNASVGGPLANVVQPVITYGAQTCQDPSQLF